MDNGWAWFTRLGNCWDQKKAAQDGMGDAAPLLVFSAGTLYAAPPLLTKTRTVAGGLVACVLDTL